MEDLEWFNPVARAAAVWTQKALTPVNAEYVRLLPKGPVAIDGFQLLHGSPVDEDEYVVGSSDALQALAYVEARLNFFGHTHLQGGFRFYDETLHVLARPDESGTLALRLDDESVYLINPGSVGQPRDGDARAAYAIFDAKSHCVTYCRATYDVQRSQRKILDAGLPPSLAHRLTYGR